MVTGRCCARYRSHRRNRPQQDPTGFLHLCGCYIFWENCDELQLILHGSSGLSQMAIFKTRKCSLLRTAKVCLQISQSIVETHSSTGISLFSGPHCIHRPLISLPGNTEMILHSQNPLTLRNNLNVRGFLEVVFPPLDTTILAIGIGTHDPVQYLSVGPGSFHAVGA